MTSKKITPRLHLFTGKGGTGKTTLAQAFALSLKEKKNTVFYIPFDQHFDEKHYKALHLPAFCLDNNKTTLDYISEKLGSQLIANWITGTHFFKALYQMLPSVHYLILLAEVLKMLEKDKKLHLVLDLPSTGHALTIFETSDNFINIFKKGALFNDVTLIKEKLFDANYTELFLCTLPTELSYSESLELVESLEELKLKNIRLAFNHAFSAIENLNIKKLPKILQQKIKEEMNILETKHAYDVAMTLPYLSEKDQRERVLRVFQILEEQK